VFIEGALIEAYAIGAQMIYVYIRGEYKKWIDLLQVAVDDAYQKGYIGKNILGSGFSTDLQIYRGAGAYICGEESSQMNSIEGSRGYPRIKPPFPAQSGMWGCPTTINNIETISNVPAIINRGWEWYSKIGATKHPGPLLYGISGHVNKPGVYELPTGVLLTDLIYNTCGGVKGGKNIKAVIPGGSSTMWLRGEELEGVRMDADSLKAVGTSIGTAGVIVMDEDTDVIKVLARIAHFYHHESCGQCTPCREGTGWMEKILKRFLAGEGTLQDIDLLLDVANNIEGNTICALGDAAAWPVQSVIKKFRDEFEKRAKKSPSASVYVKPPHLVETTIKV
jgi:NADH-quinone oxidoreductase subunit F